MVSASATGKYRSWCFSRFPLPYLDFNSGAGSCGLVGAKYHHLAARIHVCVCTGLCCHPMVCWSLRTVSIKGTKPVVDAMYSVVCHDLDPHIPSSHNKPAIHECLVYSPHLDCVLWRSV